MKKQCVKLTSVWLLIFTTLSLQAFCQNTLQIKGSVWDGQTGQPLSFASVSLEGTTLGTVSNLSGEFVLEIPERAATGNLLVHFLGYDSQKIPVTEVGNEPLKVVLNPATIELAEVEIRPLSPEEYITMAMEKRAENYGSTYRANAYFRQVTTDKSVPVKLSEGYFLTFQPDFMDTLQLQQRLLLYEKKDMHEIAFGKRRGEKKFEKSKKKAKRSGEAFDEEKAREDAAAVSIGTISPSDVIEMDPVKGLEAFIDPERLDEYAYAFEENTVYQGREMIVIRFQSKGKVKPSEGLLKGRQGGTLYFDKATDALASVVSSYKMSIPAALKPILFLMGYSISNPLIHRQVNYQLHEGKWYQQATRLDMDMKLTSRHLFSKNEVSELHVNALIAFSQYDTESPEAIAKEVRFDDTKDMEEQVKPIPRITWAQVNRISLEN